MPEDFRVGDVVRLKSGGADMTVQALTAANGDVVASNPAQIRCVYFTQGHELKVTHGMDPAMLEMVDAGPREDEYGRGRPDTWDSPGDGNAENNSASGLNRPRSAALQSYDQASVHNGDDLPQSLGHEAERQPAQESEIGHVNLTDDPNDDIGTVHETPPPNRRQGPAPSPAVR